MLSCGCLVRMTDFDMHFRFAKIKVATSVCTGGRNSPPDCFIKMGSNPAIEKAQNPQKRILDFWCELFYRI